VSTKIHGECSQQRRRSLNIESPALIRQESVAAEGGFRNHRKGLSFRVALRLLGMTVLGRKPDPEEARLTAEIWSNMMMGEQTVRKESA
jgi:hypothetical protein